MSALVDHHEAKQTLRRAKTASGGFRHPVNQAHYDERTWGERVADRLSAGMGSWTFMIIQSIALLAWIALNAFGLLIAHWDPYPFILLNLALSLQATYAGQRLPYSCLGILQAMSSWIFLKLFSATSA